MGGSARGPIHLRTLASTIASFVGKKLARAPGPLLEIVTSDRAVLLSRIEQFEKHVAFGLHLIEEQRLRLDRIRSRGLNAKDAEAILIQLQAAQILYHECLENLLDALVRLNEPEEPAASRSRISDRNAQIQ